MFVLPTSWVFRDARETKLYTLFYSFVVLVLLFLFRSIALAIRST